MGNQLESERTAYGAQTNSMALISLITGILGLTLFPVIGSIVAVITGPIARKEIEQSQGAQTGEGLATAGIILGWIGIALGVLGICAVGAVFAIPACLFSFGVIEGSNWLLPSLFSIFI